MGHSVRGTHVKPDCCCRCLALSPVRLQMYLMCTGVDSFLHMVSEQSLESQSVEAH